MKTNELINVKKKIQTKFSFFITENTPQQNDKNRKYKRWQTCSQKKSPFSTEYLTTNGKTLFRLFFILCFFYYFICWKIKSNQVKMPKSIKYLCRFHLDFIFLIIFFLLYFPVYFILYSIKDLQLNFIEAHSINWTTSETFMIRNKKVFLFSFFFCVELCG